MKIKESLAEGSSLSPLFLTLVLSTILSPVLPGISLAVIAAIAWWKREKHLLDIDMVSGTLLGLVAVALIATLLQGTAWGFVSILFFVLYFFVYLWMKENLTVSQFYHGLTIMSVAGVGIVGVMLLKRAGGVDFLPASIAYFFGLESWKPTVSLRSTGTSGNANLAASLLVCLALISFYKIIARGRVLFRHRLLWAAVFVIYLVGFELTGTRMAWIAVSMGIAGQVWLLYGPEMKASLRQLPLAKSSFFAAGGLLFLLGKDWLPRAESFNADLALRVEIWERSLQLFQQDWLFGVLPLHFGEVFKAHFGQYEFHAHNLFIGIAVDFGIIGFSLFMLLLVTSLIRGLQWVRWANTAREKGLAVVLMSFIIAFLGQGMADYTVLVPQTGWLFLLSLGFIHIRWLHLVPAKHAHAVRRKVVY